MKKIFKKLFTCLPILGFALPIVSCSKNNENKTIEILSNLNDLTVMEDEQHLSKPIEAKCFNSDKSETPLDIKFHLEPQNNEKLPNWIYLTEKNEIMLTGGKTTGSYTFKLFAYNEQEKLCSEGKSFNVNVIGQRHILPDRIDLNIESGKYFMFGQNGMLPITVIPSKEEVEEKFLLKSCIFSLEVLSGQSLDKKGNPLFSFSDSNIDPNLLISNQTDESYIGQYNLKITATLQDDPTIWSCINITLYIDNIYVYIDSDNKYTYTRESADQDWTLSQVDSSVKGLTKILDKIQNKPVSKIGANLCSKSKISQLVEIILPSNIIAIGDNAFADQLTLCLGEMPGVVFVGNNAFKNDSIFELNNHKDFPDFIYVGNDAFYGCKNFKISSLKNLQQIGDYAFNNAGLSQIEIGKNCTYIGTECFANCSSLNSFKILAEKPPILAGGTFSKTYGIKTVSVPAQSLELYRADSNWSALGVEFVGI